jgi:hypothetical protein
VAVAQARGHIRFRSPPQNRREKPIPDKMVVEIVGLDWEIIITVYVLVLGKLESLTCSPDSRFHCQIMERSCCAAIWDSRWFKKVFGSSSDAREEGMYEQASMAGEASFHCGFRTLPLINPTRVNRIFSFNFQPKSTVRWQLRTSTFPDAIK